MEHSPISIGVLFTGAGFVVNIIVFVVGAVWAVGKIKSHTDLLSQSIEHLTSSIEGLKRWLEKLDVAHDETRERVTALESGGRRRRQP